MLYECEGLPLVNAENIKIETKRETLEAILRTI